MATTNYGHHELRIRLLTKLSPEVAPYRDPGPERQPPQVGTHPRGVRRLGRGFARSYVDSAEKVGVRRCIEGNALMGTLQTDAKRS